MDRRNVLKLALLPVGGLFGCAAPAVYDKSKYGPIRRVGIIAYPQRFDVEVSRDINMFSQAGENAAGQSRVIAALSTKCDGFEVQMRKQLAETLKAGGIGSSDVPYRDQGPFMNPTMRIPNYKGAGEPLYLESQISLCFVRLSDGIAPGAGTFNRLVTEDGEALWGDRISIGPSVFWRSRVVGMPARRYKDIAEVTSASDEAAAILMGLATPLGRAVGEALVEEAQRS